jgi:hypothetical protein
MPSKLGPFSLKPHADVARLIEAGCPVVKCADHLGQAEKWLAARPDLLVIGKLTETYDVLAAARSGQAPEAAALDYVRRQRDAYRLNPAVKIWEGPAGPDCGLPNDPAAMQAMAWYADFEAERLKLLSDLGLRGVSGNFPAGTPELALWAAFLPALDAIEHFNGYLGLREYSSPWLWWGTGHYQSGAEMDEGDRGWFTLRYRRVYRECLSPNGFGETPLLITECGLGTVATERPGLTNGPWLALFDFWRAQDGASDPVDYWRGQERNVGRYYAEQLIWYDRELQKDVYVAGAAIAVVGQMDEAWRPFDLAGTEVMSYLVDHIRAQRPDWPEAGVSLAVEQTLPSNAKPALPLPASSLALSELNVLGESLETGQADFCDHTRELAVPAGWQLSIFDETTPMLAGQIVPFSRPVTALVSGGAVASADRERIFPKEGYRWRISGADKPVWVRLSRTASGLWPGLRYRFAVQLLPDLIAQLRPQLAYAADPLAGEVRLIVTPSEAQRLESGWKNGAEAPFGQHSPLTLEFAAVGESAEVAVEVRGRWALPLGAWYIGGLSLKAI